MSSPVIICNKALAHLGVDFITSLDDPGKVAELCKLNYPTLRDAVISARMWRFAQLRLVSRTSDRPEEGNSDPDYPQWGDEFVHTLPSDYLQVFRAYRETISKKTFADWQQQGKYILSQSDLIYLEGVKSVTDASRFSPLFVEALAARIAAHLAVPITSNRQLKVDMFSLYNDMLSEAAVRDGQQGRAEKTDSTTLTGARSR